MKENNVVILDIGVNVNSFIETTVIFNADCSCN